MEADEEASIKVIEIESVQEEESAAKEGQTSIDEQDATTDASPSKEQEIKLEETSEANTQSPPASEEVKLDKPEATEEPVTNTFDNSPNGPISESTVTLP
jgi:hypothetical protein